MLKGGKCTQERSDIRKCLSTGRGNERVWFQGAGGMKIGGGRNGRQAVRAFVFLSVLCYFGSFLNLEVNA